MRFHEDEEKILKFWQENRIFEKSLEKEGGDFVFYDGPPFATGLPHYGHILATIIKDVIPRYQTMKGKRVPRKWGWDCHGLPVENLIEKELNLKSKKDIEEYGVEKFNKKAEESVLRYADEWKKIIPRMGRWVDMENDYKTMDTNYTESVWYVFKTLYDKGLIYEGYKPMHLCPRCETTLSNFEVTQNYQEIEDISVTVKFELEDELGTFVLAWTTTPWTLPGNVALAVNPDIEYVKFSVAGNEKVLDGAYIVSQEDMKEYEGETGVSVLEKFKGEELIGKKYKPLFDYYTKDEKLENRENGWKIYGADFVVTDEGTGIVHIAPAFGEEDMLLRQKEKLPFVQHVTTDGRFKKEIADFAGAQVKPKGNLKETDKKIIEWLKNDNKLFHEELVKHSYPFCWRCDTPLLNYAAASWFVSVEKIKDKLIKNNSLINWVPEHLKNGRFGKWLEGAHDWAISRSRYWGAPLPVWKCQKCGEVRAVGSIDEIKEGLNGINKLFLVRHGEAEHNIGSTVCSSDKNKTDLTEKGKKQIKEMAGFFKKEKIDLIFSSPFYRTQKTAGAIAKATGAEIILDSRLREVDLGEFDGKQEYELARVYPTRESRIRDTKFGVESGEEIRKRFEDFLDEINKKYKNKKIIIVSHGDPLQIFHGVICGLTIEDSLSDWYPVLGSIKQVYSRSVDLHRPYIDEIKLKCGCGDEMKRIPEVFDCWFESGSMPYSQEHYPFENKENFENNFPAEFIAEGVDQTRGWFYTLLVLSTAMFDEPAYKNVIANGIILAEDGQKMSKRLKNYPDPMYIVEKYGADSLRYYLLSSPAVRAENLNFSERGVDEVNKKVISKIRNVLSFYKLYENSGFPEKEGNSDNVLDKWIWARFNQTVLEVSKFLDKYELDKAIKPMGEFTEDLSNWYLRRSRERFKNAEKEPVLKILKQLLSDFSRLLAPFVPFIAEYIYKDLTGGKQESVHLEKWPKFDKKMIDEKLLDGMKTAREIVSLVLDSRMAGKIKVRQPLAWLKVKNKKLEGYEDLLALIKDEVNVKEILFDEKINNEIELNTEITEELREEGAVRDLVRVIQDLRKKTGLNPQDKARLVIETDKAGEEFVNKFMGGIKKITNMEILKFSENNGQKMEIAGRIYKIEVLNI